MSNNPHILITQDHLGVRCIEDQDIKDCLTMCKVKADRISSRDDEPVYVIKGEKEELYNFLFYITILVNNIELN